MVEGRLSHSQDEERIDHPHQDHHYDDDQQTPPQITERSSPKSLLCRFLSFVLFHV
jgi:hypothetical protein